MGKFFLYLNQHEQYFRQHGEVAKYKKGRVVVSKFNESDWVFFLSAGKVKVSLVLGDETEHLVGYFLPGMTFAQLGAFFTKPLEALEFEAIEDSSTYRMHRSEFFKAMKKDKKFNEEYLGQVQRTQMFLIERIGYQGQKGVKAKFVHWLLFMVKYYSDEDGGECLIDIPVTHEIIANFLHATRESVSKAMNDLRKDGHIRSVSKKIIVKDLDSLQQYAKQIQGVESDL